MRGVVVNAALVLAFLAFLAPTLKAQESEDEPQRGDIAVVKVKMNIAKIVVRKIFSSSQSFDHPRMMMFFNKR